MSKVLKAVNGHEFPMGDFLVASKEDDTSTWRLQVKKHGIPDQKLMKLAYLYLTRGFRGKTYDGPRKKEALTKLRALYRGQDWDMPAKEAAIEEVEAEELDLEECYNSYYGSYYNPYQGALDFASLRAAQAQQKRADSVTVLSYEFQTLSRNILNSEAVPPEEKPELLAALADEFKIELDLVMNEYPDEEIEYEESAKPVDGEIEETGIEVRVLSEASEIDQTGPVKIKIAFIEPGWGNERDNNYYSREAVAEGAHVFEGLKMHTTDHKEEERSVRTEVATILKSPIGFTETGAPIALVGVHNPILAADIRNRAALGVLDKLEVSILASGTTQKGTVGGKQGNIVQKFTKGHYIDFVTKAGAGGRTISLAESAKGAEMGAKTQAEEPAQNGSQPAAAESGSLPPCLGEAGATGTCQYCKAAIKDGKVVEDEDAKDGKEKKESSTPAPATTSGIQFLAEAGVKTLLEASRLPKVSIDRLLESGKFLDQDAVMAAVAAERAYIKKLTGSGIPEDNFPANGMTAAEGGQQPVANGAGTNGNLDAVNEKWGM